MTGNSARQSVDFQLSGIIPQKAGPGKGRSKKSDKIMTSLE